MSSYYAVWTKRLFCHLVACNVLKIKVELHSVLSVCKSSSTRWNYREKHIERLRVFCFLNLENIYFVFEFQAVYFIGRTLVFCTLHHTIRRKISTLYWIVGESLSEKSSINPPSLLSRPSRKGSFSGVINEKPFFYQALIFLTHNTGCWRKAKIRGCRLTKKKFHK